MIDLQARRLLDKLHGAQALDELGLDGARRWAATLRTRTRTDLAAVRDLLSPSGIRVRVYRADRRTDLPIMVFAHGGGWIFGGLDSSDELCRRLAVASGCAVVSVDYRVAPENPHPAAVDDVHDVLVWLSAVARDHGLDPTRIILAGESSGAHVVLCAAMLGRTQDVSPSALLLLCPPIDRTQSTPSWEELGDRHSPRRSEMAWMWSLYLGEDARFVGDYPDPSVGPLEGIPRSVVTVAEYDPLRDEGKDLVRRMDRSGIPVDLIECVGQIHPVGSHAPFVDACDSYLRHAAQKVAAIVAH